MQTKSNTIIANSGVKFGTSGARGLVEQFTPNVCAAFTLAFITAMQHTFAFNRISIAIDRRPSSPNMAAACIAAAKHLGLEIDYFGVIPTPALAYQSMQAKQPAIMITGSHIPFDRNGIKFYRPDGEITKADETLIITTQAEVPEQLDLTLPAASQQAENQYIARYQNLVAPNLLQGKRVGIYQHSSAGRDLYTKLFTQLGADVIPLGRSEEFVPIDTEAVRQEDIEQGKIWAKQHKLDFLFSTDGDGDRPLIADETGQWLRGDLVGLLTARYLKIDALAIPISCNTAIEASGAFQKTTRTQIGSPYVIEGMQQLTPTYQRIAGFEANGGFLLGSDIELDGQTLTALPTRDALLPIIALMAASIEPQHPLSHLLADLPQRYTASNRIQNFATEKSQQLIQAWSQNPKEASEQLGLQNKTIIQQNQIDGLRWTFDDQTIVHLRPSGNAPELRCYTEAGTQQQAETLLKQTLALLEKLAN
ncbi:phosphomannomutase [Thiomicrospira microaerophila]|uniref:phosphomannomutase n=1 Tax=Thiomicrospira microaerophila TaxID=406020 RepID=UPI0005CB6248|nr:phosphomannomutase [Thiomicrospira microaerophila]